VVNASVCNTVIQLLLRFDRMLERAALGWPSASEGGCLSSAETRLATRKKNWRL